MLVDADYWRSLARKVDGDGGKEERAQNVRERR